MAKVNCSDLIGSVISDPDGDCLHGCAEVLRRMGRDDAARDLLQSLETGAPAETWERIGGKMTDATQLGDVVLMEGTDDRPHAVILVDDSPPRVLSSSAGLGVHVFGRDRLRALIGVYRHNAS